ncbi:hypothetical protein GYMLUDRAFT_36473 [Collybiopsis luxurians FD-317 M1]|nr:hypothetical protein GYMLUDRAFT_36473 [Collybiopsis luxurians FD-317 M1]
MGQWTLARYDEVFNSKIKSLVSGAIKRSKLEKAEPQISFKDFVEELDVGDSFTTSLVDILVQELADRRTRTTADDRRLISEKTAKSLRTITGPNRVYFSSRYRRMSTGRGHLPMYLTHPPEEMEMDDDEEEFDSILDTDPSLTRVATDSSTVTIGGGTTMIPFRSTSPAPLTPSDEAPPSVPFSRSWIPPRSHITSGHSLNRSSSIRRPTRSRTVDFNDFTSRRRSTIRNNSDTSGGSNESSTNPDFRDRDHIWVPPSGTRRFFAGLRHRRADTDSLWTNFTTDDLAPDSASRRSGSDLSVEAEGSLVDSSSATSLDLVPRLRRGGLRAPESLLSRQVSPSESMVPTGDTDSRRAPSPPEISEFILDSPRFRSIPIQEPEGGATFGVEVTSYPTPETTFDSENAT